MQDIGNQFVSEPPLPRKAANAAVADLEHFPVQNDPSVLLWLELEPEMVRRGEDASMSLIRQPLAHQRRYEVLLSVRVQVGEQIVELVPSDPTQAFCFQHGTPR